MASDAPGDGLLAVITTVGRPDDARRIADAVIERRLAACVQWVPIDSVYRWDGAIQHDTEVRLTIKTTASRWPALHDALVELHPYELPAIHAVKVEHAHAAYAEWVRAETQVAAGPGTGPTAVIEPRRRS